MPEIPKRADGAVIRAKNILSSGDDFFGYYDAQGNILGRQEINEVKTSSGVVASGSEQMAFQHPTDPNKLQFVSYQEVNPDRAKLVFYTHRVLHTLFPHNFPRIYASFGEKEGFTSGTVREKVVSDRQEKKPQHSLQKAFDTLAELGFKPVVEYSSSSVHNVMTSSDGEYFIEVITKTLRDFDQEKVMQYMTNTMFSLHDKEAVQRALQKIAEIRERIGNDEFDMVEATRMIALGLVKPQDPEYDAMVNRLLNRL